VTLSSTDPGIDAVVESPAVMDRSGVRFSERDDSIAEVAGK
jgi:hypothetical protein